MNNINLQDVDGFYPATFTYVTPDGEKKEAKGFLIPDVRIANVTIPNVYKVYYLRHHGAYIEIPVSVRRDYPCAVNHYGTFLTKEDIPIGVDEIDIFWQPMIDTIQELSSSIGSKYYPEDVAAFDKWYNGLRKISKFLPTINIDEDEYAEIGSPAYDKYYKELIGEG